MSYDVEIENLLFIHPVNGDELFNDHFLTEEDQDGCQIVGVNVLNEKTGIEAAKAISEFFTNVSETRIRMGDFAFCKRYDSSNRLASTIGALMFMSNVLAACAMNPTEKVYVT